MALAGGSRTMRLLAGAGERLAAAPIMSGALLPQGKSFAPMLADYRASERLTALRRRPLDRRNTPNVNGFPANRPTARQEVSVSVDHGNIPSARQG